MDAAEPAAVPPVLDAAAHRLGGRPLPRLCSSAVVHWVRFPEKRAQGEVQLPTSPEGSASWKFGPEMIASTAAARAGSTIWGGIAAFPERADAETALERPDVYLPDLGDASESWRALLVPFAHKGECNHLGPAMPGVMFEAQPDPGGPLLVMTTAGFELQSRADFQRLIDFRRNVAEMRAIIAAADGSLANEVFTPVGPRDDGITMSLWRDEKSMFAFAYKPGAHRTQVDRQNSERTVDRSSFTRFRVVKSEGSWGGRDPLALQPSGAHA